MIKYQVKSAGEVHEVLATTFTQSDQLRLIGDGGAVVAIFVSFEWIKVIPAEPAPASPGEPSTQKPELAGE